MRCLTLSILTSVLFATTAMADGRTLLNVSYDPTREFYQEYNALFTRHWKTKTGETVAIRQSHGGSARQAHAVMDGLAADVVTLALAADIDAIAHTTPLIPAGWQTRLPNDSTPYTSTVVFLVHKGNPKHIKDWNDLVKPGMQVLTPNPKTSGGARWNYLAALAYALEANNGDEKKATEFLRKLFANVPILDTGARGATTNFIRRGLGDVLIAWENEAQLVVNGSLGSGQYEIVYPSLSIRAEPAVSVVEGVARAHHTEELAWDYLTYLYSPEAQAIAANHYYRPSDETVAAKYKNRFPDMRMKTIADFGGWDGANSKYFADGAMFDQIYGK